MENIKEVLCAKISLKILLWVIPFSILTVFCSVSWLEYDNYHSRLGELEEKQRALTQGQAIFLGDLISEGREDQVLAALSGTLADPDIIGAKVVSTNGQTLYQFGNIRVLSGRFVVNWPVTAFVNNELVNVGTLTTVASESRTLELIVNNIYKMIKIMSIVMVAVIVATFIAMYRIVGIPISLMVASIRRGQENGFNPVEWTSSDEIGIVVEEFNDLIRQQYTRIRGLRSELSVRDSREAERMRSLVDAAFEGIIIHAGGRILDVNHSAVTMINSNRKALIGNHISSFLSKDAVRCILGARSPDRAHTLEAALKAKGDQQVPVELICSSIKHVGQDAQVIAIRDIRERLASQAFIRHMALHDELTDLPNRRYYYEHLDRLIHHETSNCFSLLALDLDRFKIINDSFGHAAGDELLVKVAQCLTNAVRENDLVARLGGDEFAVILEHESGSQDLAEKLAERIIKDICEPFHLSFGTCHIGVSIGIAHYPDHSSDVEAIARLADGALYLAKKNGRSRFCSVGADHSAEFKPEPHQFKKDHVAVGV